MPKGLVNESSLNSIGSAINVLNGTEGTYAPSEMGEAIIDAIPTKTASGNPIRITDAAAYPAESVVTTLEPVQDLHGYGKPWPAGGGKNLFDSSTVEQGTLNETGGERAATTRIRTPYIYLSAGSYTLSNSDMRQVVYVYNPDTNKTFIPEESYTSWQASDFSFTFAGDRYVRFVFSKANNPDIAPSDLQNAQLELGSTATAYEPYSNICPITGHTGVELTRTGKNLFDIDDLWDNGTVINGVKSIMLSSLPAGTYTISTDVINNTDASVANVFAIKNYDTPSSNRNGVYVGSSRSITLSSGDTLTIAIRVTNVGGKSYLVWNKTTFAPYYIQLELGSTATAYEPYQGETYSITFPQAQSPVYGGEVDWVNGVLRVNKVDADLSSLTWTARQTGEVNVAYSTDLPQEYLKNANAEDFIAEQYRFVSKRNGSGELANPDSQPIGFYLYSGSGSGSTVDRTSTLYILVPKEHQIDGKFVYPLATPLEIPLTPEVIALLKGENNIWADAGTSEIEYKVDLQSYIQKLINEASTNASALSVSPLSLGKSAAVSTDGESEEAEELPVEDVESVDEADEAEEKPTELLVEEDTEEEPTEKEPDTLEKEGGDTV